MRTAAIVLASPLILAIGFVVSPFIAGYLVYKVVTDPSVRWR